MLDDEVNDNTAQQSNGSESSGEQPPVPDTVDDAPVAKKATARKAAVKKAPVKKAVAKKTATRKTAAKKAVADPGTPEAPVEVEAGDATVEAPVKKAAAKRTRKAPAKKAAALPEDEQAALPLAGEASSEPDTDESAGQAPTAPDVLFQAPEKTPVRRTRKKVVPAPAADESVEGEAAPEASSPEGEGQAPAPKKKDGPKKDAKKGSSNKAKTPKAEKVADSDEEAVKAEAESGAEVEGDENKTDSNTDESGDRDSDSSDGENQGPRRRRRRGGRRRRKAGDSSGSDADGDSDDAEESDDDSGNGDGDGESTGSRRRRRRRRAGDNGSGSDDDPENTVTRVRQTRSAEDQITAVAGSTRLEAKKQRRREGREAGRRRAPIVSEAEFLARRESVERVMVIRQREDLTQIAVLEDKVLVEHYVARESQTSLIGNVYIGRVQNVLPSMEAAFVDIGKGRNAVIYAGEINWAGFGHKDGQPRKIESVLSSGQSILVQVTKDPIGHKGARLTGQVSLAGRFLVYVPDGTTSGISRKLPDTERSRLKSLLKQIVPDTAGVIVRTAAEGASEEELTQDVERLKARWEAVEEKSKGGGSPQLLYGEPDLTLKVVRDLFTEDFTKLVIEGDDAWDTVQGYVSHVAPDLEERLERYQSDNGRDSFSVYRIDEQIAKGVDRKVWLPSGGSLIIDRTEAMTVVDVNTGKFTGSGGNLEETVTKNNLEAAEEIVRQLRLRDIGGIIVVDFIDMVLESNRDLVLRRLVECLGRDRTRHQVAEVTSLGLIQMTRKRIGTGLLEAFSEDCSHCAGRGLIVHEMPIEPKDNGDDRGGRSGRRSRGRGKGDDNDQNGGSRNDKQSAGPSPKDVAAVAKAENADKPAADEAESADSGQQDSNRNSRSRSRGGRGRRENQGGDNQGSDNQGSDNGADAKGESRDQSGNAGSDQASPAPAPSATAAAEASREPQSAPKAATKEPRSTDSAPKGATGPKADEPAAGTTTKVVTRTRRKASRPAGVAAAPAEAITIAPTKPTPEAVTTAPVAAPAVVTRTTRTRRGASRLSGASTDQAAQQESAPAGAESAGTEAAAAGETPTADGHVPINKKGSSEH